MEQPFETFQRAVLISVDTGEFDAESSLEEFSALAKAAGAEPILTILQHREACDSATCMGEGKLKELCEYLETEPVDLLLFDRELTGTQMRNLERITGLPVVDRTALILDIFASRAHSNEGRLQVELAQYQYLLPRLSGMGSALSRQAGGIGTRGPGESKLEMDRRHIRRRIRSLKEELVRVEARRQRLRERRKKDLIATVALVGYTNVGKSSLLNQLTEGGAQSQDCLFATLDPTSRLLELPDGRNVILIDTVGFLRRLPHSLIEAFHATLEETVFADVIVHLVNAADPEAEEQRKTVEELLQQLGCQGTPILTVYNHADELPDDIIKGHEGTFISAKTGFGLSELLVRISRALPSEVLHCRLKVPYSRGELTAKVRKNGKVLSEEFCEDGILLDAMVDRILLSELERYRIEEEKD